MRTAPKGANFLWVNRTLRTRGKFYGKLKKTVGQKLFFYLSYLYLDCFVRYIDKKRW